MQKSRREEQNEEMRLNKYLAHSGVASRRKSDEFIVQGLVKVNGNVVTEVGYKVLLTDKIEFEGKIVNPEKKIYVLLNKPKGFITTTDDEKDRRTVMDLVKGVYGKLKIKTPLRLYPVGRLDRNTTGVLLITNDGDLSKKLTHPSSNVVKVYKAILDKPLLKEDFEAISKGTTLEDGLVLVDEIAYPEPNATNVIGLEIHLGRNRIVRRLFEHYGYTVEKLDRVLFAGLTKKDLPRGRWRLLTDNEVRELKRG